MKPPPIVFVSYSHDSEEHSNWVLQLATRLRANGVDAILDRWNLRLGQDLAAFMEEGLSNSHRVLCICSRAYVDKADEGKGGVGYEKQIITAELLADLNQDWVIPVIRDNPQTRKLPRFLGSRVYIDFEEDRLYENKYEELLRELLDEPVLPIPKLGKNPFETAEAYAQQSFIPGSEKYVSPTPKGNVTFDYSNNNGKYSIGSGAYMFETKWSKGSDRSIRVYSDPPSIRTVALVKDKQEISSINDARVYDGSSRVRSPNVGQIVLLQNMNGFFAALKVLDIKDDTRGSQWDELTFEYVIQTNGTPDFTKPS
ncbi:MAG: TIR domain-containing protein [Nitrospira sp. SB0677_bin_15]|nr:TIR domain-containing protein [Nitrospira sp. SB0677_bin_15]